MGYDNSNAAAIAGFYRQYLGREPDQKGWQGYESQAAGGRSLQSIAREIATSQEAKDNVTRARDTRTQLQAANTAAAGYQRDLQGLQGQILGYQNQMRDYETRIQGFQGQLNEANTNYQNALGKAREWETKAGDWEDQFNTRTQEYEAARDEAAMYREQAVGQQLRALRSGATSGGGNQTSGGRDLTSGKTSYQAYDDKAIEIEKNIKAESGALSAKGKVVERLRQAPTNRGGGGAPQGASSGSYYASRFG